MTAWSGMTAEAAKAPHQTAAGLSHASGTASSADLTAGQRAKAPGQARVSRSERLNFIGPLALLLKERQRNANQLDPLKFRSSHRFFKPFEELPSLSLVVLCRVRICQLLY